MKLRSLAVNQFKRFTEPTRLGALNDGLNLVVGPNELGKSTLLDALRAVLFERYSSRARPIVALQNDRSGAAPVVELVFEIDGGEYVLSKRFVKSAYALLQCPDGTRLEADSAEAELRRLLGFSEAGTRGANPETLGMWGVLWVQQGQSFGRPNLPDSALASLSAGLESEVGAVLGGRRGRELPQVIEQRRSELITVARRQPRGEYKDALEQCEAAAERLDAQRTRRQDIADTLEQLESAEARLRRLLGSEQDRLDAEDLQATRERLAQEELLDSRIAAAQSDLQLRLEQLERAEQALEARTAARAELEREEARLAGERQRLTELEAEDRDSTAQFETLRQRVAEAEAAVVAAEDDTSRQRDTLDTVTSGEELRTLVARRDAADAAQERLNQARRESESIRTTDQALRRIREAANAVDRVAAQIGGAATRISFEIPPERLAGIEVHGAPLSDPNTPIETVEPLTITIPGRGRIQIDPNVAEREQLLEDRSRAEAALRSALDAAGAVSLADAELQGELRREQDQAAAVARQELELLAPEGVAALRERVESLQTRLAARSPGASDQARPSREEAETAVRRAEQTLSEARERERAARAAAAERSEAVAEQRERMRALRAEIDYGTDLIERRQADLARAESELSNDQLTLELTAAQQQAELSESVAETLIAKRSVAARPQLEARIARLETVLRERDQTRADLRTEIARLHERVELHDSAGIDEAIEHSERELELVTRRREQLEREIAVLDLLAATLREADSEARERYLAPVLNRVRPYLQMLFANAEISMDEDLNITGMSRHAGYEERFDHLSMGTQEQIAVLVRLAFAEMLVEQGAPAAVILDDALVFSDDQRMRLMFDILQHAAQRVQIVVFTCREQLFEGLGARQLHLTPADPESLRSA